MSATANIIVSVNPSTGSDTPSGPRPALLSGGDYSAIPFATVQAAIDALDKVLGKFTAQVQIAAATVAGFLVEGFVGGSVEILGTTANVSPTTGVASGTAGTGTNNTHIVKPSAAANWTANELRGAMVVITGGAGYYANSYIPFFGACARRITGNDATNIYFDSWGFGTLDNTTTFAIVRPATLVQECPTNVNNITFCAGAVMNESRVVFRNFKTDVDSTVFYNTFAQSNSGFEQHGLDFPQLANGNNHMSVSDTGVALFSCLDSLGDGTEISFLSGNQSVKFTSWTVGNVQIYLKENVYVYAQVDAKASAHRVVRPSYCNHVVLDVNANDATATVVDLVACDYVETVRLSGTNGSIGASGPAVTVDGGGKYDFTGATITGPTTDTLRIGSDSFVSWAKLSAGSYTKGSTEVLGSSAQNPLIPSRTMSKLVTPDNVNASVAAAGTSQSDATQLTKPITVLTSGNQGTPQGVKLPSADTADVPFMVINDISGANAGTVGIRVYPQSGESISPMAANVGDLLQPGMMGFYIPLGGGKWRNINMPVKQDATSFTASGLWYFYQTAHFQTQIACNSFAPQAAADMQLIGSLSNSFTFKDNDTGTAIMTFDTSNDVVVMTHAFQDRRRVSALTADTTLATTDTGRAFNNTGATGAVTATLPAAVAGKVIRLRVTAAQSFRLKPAAGDSIQFGAVNCDSSHYIGSATVGDVIEVEAQDGDLWVVTTPAMNWAKV